ncbi:GNAT family N-acetyltransferase [Falsibacillus pallidus]|uniref:GNAT family N-acetyltransferase n=1 Tax=Falsibacillus pallidus TaxID=493781 RepID=UPI003D9599F6
MIRRLTEADHEKVMELVLPKAAENLFIIGDIEAYGYEQDFQTLWGDFDNEGTLRGILLKYQQNYIPFAEDVQAFDAFGFAKLIGEDEGAEMVSGLEAILERVRPFLPWNSLNERKFYYAKCTRAENVPSDMGLVKQAQPADAERIMDLYKQIEEFNSAETAEQKRRNMEKGTARSFYIEMDGEMISAASTAAENSQSAMVVGVCTLPSYTKKGYGSMCVSKVCQVLLAEGKELCLFYDNPAAGSIYKRIGFKDIGFWTMYKRNRD